MKSKGAIALFVFIMIQFFQIDKINPPVNKSVDFLEVKETPEPMASTIRNACYDCHSNESNYPWYSYVQPIGWLVQKHIKDGRRHVNFSVFATETYEEQIHQLDECAEVIEEHEMPMFAYTLMHEDAKLDDETRAQMANYFIQLKEDTQKRRSQSYQEQEENDE